jgi:DNA-binding response OmpR family regulator
VQRRKEKRASETRFQASGITLDSAQRLATCRGTPVSLTTVEFELLKILLESAGQVVSRDALVRTVLGRELHPFDRSLDMHISRLRKKLEVAGSEDCIKTLRSVGYQLAILSESEIAEIRSR